MHETLSSYSNGKIGFMLGLAEEMYVGKYVHVELVRM